MRHPRWTDSPNCTCIGTLGTYEKYRASVRAWGGSPLAVQTYFDPGTDPKAARALERCRHKGTTVRLILGDLKTGEPWLEEHDVVGRIGRWARSKRPC